MTNLSVGVWAAMTLTACAHSPAPGTRLTNPPLVIAHRGASGYLPEHTLVGYEKAIEMGADYIELDLVATKDGELFVRHENEISGTTDVAAKFPKRKTKKTVDGAVMEGWFTEDFTAAEIRTLRAKERLPIRPQGNNGKFAVPTLLEIIRFAKEQEKKAGRKIGLYIETKHPSYFSSIGIALEPKLLKILDAEGLNREDAKIYLQSFELTGLKILAKSTRLPLVFLYEDRNVRPYDLVLANDPRTYGDFLSEAGLKEVAKTAKGIGPWKNLVDAALVSRAHAAGLVVHPYTFRSDVGILPPEYGGDPAKEYAKFFQMGVDGVFSDFTDHAVSARKSFRFE